MLKKLPTIFLSIFMLAVLLMSACAAPEGPAETPQAPGVIPETGEQEGNLPVRMSTLIEAEVVDNQGQSSGQIIEVILNPFGLPEYVIVSEDNQYVPVPLTAFLWDQEQEQLVFGLDRELLDGAPRFSSLDEFPAVDIAGWDLNIAGYWVEHVDITGATEQSPVQWNVPRRVTLALQSPVVDFEGEEIGSVEDVLYNEMQERGFVVIEHDGQLRPVPWDEFDWDQVGARLIYLYDLDRLQNSPGYGSLDELDTTGDNWEDEIVEYWRLP